MCFQHLRRLAGHRRYQRRTRGLAGSNYLDLFAPVSTRRSLLPQWIFDDPFRISLSRTAPHYKSSNSTTCKRLNSYATRSEQPLHPEITIDSISQTSQENARVILDHLIREGFVLVDEAQSSTADAHHNFNPAQGTAIRSERLIFDVIAKPIRTHVGADR